MTVKELIEKLKTLPEEDTIYFDTTLMVINNKCEGSECDAYEEEKEDEEGKTYNRAPGSVLIIR